MISSEMMVGVLILPLVIVGLSVTALFLRRLRRVSRDVWEELGSPGLIRGNTPRKNMRVHRFLWSGSYRELGDWELDVLGGVLRGLHVLASIVVTVFLVSVLAGMGD